MWSERTDLPAYTPPNDLAGRIKTSILIPGKIRGRVVVALDIEAVNHLPITDDAKKELERLAEALAHLRECCDFNSSRTKGTDSALGTLREIAQAGPKFRLTTPTVFVAYSSKADKNVTNVIDEVLREFNDRIEIERWDEMEESGNVTVQIATAIERARFGICYFSEPVPSDSADGLGPFQDNPNVVFEAGMLHAFTSAAGNAPTGWLPIREDKPPDPPFDFSQQRILVVPRRADHTLNEVRFKESLRRRIADLLRED